MDKCKYIFVYGTLRSELIDTTPAKDKKDNLAFIAKGILNGVNLWDCGRYPAITEGKWNDEMNVEGQLYELKDQDTLDYFDWYEGTESGLYERRIVDISTDQGIKKAWVYFYLKDTSKFKKIDQSDYIEYLKIKNG